ncbi:hypothetical protein P152DRAFT_297762 [Eremomyces bilateralis CBS 781.70]|uniref:Uncharacterized protein n=1 Tax=Eremomyces bilateralis CBS 781.70 TaxID=1392243 RepID=A0A6G1G761_9PEZI|nr:uncharacterized protein P152DRAFT_297762 [Eremomyces bilateralis CBS 781.70]KAF1813917.1 hypothetical protein P152DRAFT_297762 [Eremomyces bilateralis CBS 781.70]
MDTIPSTPPPCLVDDRRSIVEIIVKYFVVHLTTIAAFAHSPSRGRGRMETGLLRPCARAFLFQHIAGLAAIVAIALYNAFLPRHQRTDVWEVVHCLFGIVDDDSHDDRHADDGQRFWKRFGEPLLAIGFLTQCSSSVYLYSRRLAFAPDSLTIADQKVFELASSGLFAGFTWLALKANLKPFSGAVPWRFLDWTHEF